MLMIDSQPLTDQLARIAVAETHWMALIDASEGSYKSDTKAEHAERMRKIDEAELAYHGELITLRALVQLSVERAEGKR